MLLKDVLAGVEGGVTISCVKSSLNSLYPTQYTPLRLEDRVMVDFQQKALDHFQEQKAKIEAIREEEEKKKKIKDLGNGKVEFTDSLGRTRIVDKAAVKDLMVSDSEGSMVGGE